MKSIEEVEEEKTWDNIRDICRRINQREYEINLKNNPKSFFRSPQNGKTTTAGGHLGKPLAPPMVMRNGRLLPAVGN